MNRLRVFVSSAVLLILSGLLMTFASAQEFKVGAWELDITPTEAVPMWGYGDRHASLSEGTLDPCHAVRA